MTQSVTKNLFWTSLRGRIPASSKYENLITKQAAAYERYLHLSETDKIKEYKTLAVEVNSEAFKAKEKEINALSFNNSDEGRKEQEYKKLAADKLIKNYLAICQSDELKWFNTFATSEKLQKFTDLKNYFASLDLNDIKGNVKKHMAEKQTELQQQVAQYKDLQKQLKGYFKFVNGSGFKQFKQEKDAPEIHEFLALQEKQRTEEEESRFKALKKSASVKHYLKVTTSSAYKDFLKYNDSAELAGYQELKEFIDSQVFTTLKRKIKEMDFKNTEEYKTFQELKALEKDVEIKRYNKFANSTKYKNFVTAEDSEDLKNYQNLKAFVNSDEFKERKAFLTAKNKFHLSEAYKPYARYQELLKDEDVQWYQSIDTDKAFGPFAGMELVFEDQFTEAAPSAEKWLTMPYWGDKMLNDTYGQANEEHIYTPKGNITNQHNALQINTKAEPFDGKAWHPTMGFVPKTFSVTSGTINTGNSLRQKYGVFEAKVKINKSAPVYHACWLLGNNAVPHVEVFKFDFKDTKSMHINVFSKKNASELVEVKGFDFGKDFFIFTLEWTAEKLTWKLNGYPIYESLSNIPQEPMYLNFASGVMEATSGLTGTNQMELDWVRIYQWN